MTAILKTSDEASLNTLRTTARKLGITVRFIPDEKIEDYILGKLIEESDKDKDEGAIMDIEKFLKENGCPI